jgi:hypothetical protein
LVINTPEAGMLLWLQVRLNPGLSRPGFDDFRNPGHPKLAIDTIAANLRGLPYGIDGIDESGGKASNGSQVEHPVMNELDTNARLRELCQQILEEQDPIRAEELIRALKCAVQAQHEEARLRMSYLARHYRRRLGSELPGKGAERLSHGASRIRAVLDFLGLGAGMRLGQEMEG